jgi:hypothetical protein
LNGKGGGGGLLNAGGGLLKSGEEENCKELVEEWEFWKEVGSVGVEAEEFD